PKYAKYALPFAWGCSRGPNAMPDLKMALDRSAALVKSEPKFWYNHSVRGAVLYRAGRFEEAVASLQVAAKLRAGADVAEDRLFLAMSLFRLGKADEARKSLELGRALAVQVPQEQWLPRTSAQVLCREAEALITGSPAKKRE